jgi:hypothetical protein
VKLWLLDAIEEDAQPAARRAHGSVLRALGHHLPLGQHEACLRV